MALLSEEEVGEWTQDGSFVGSDGRPVGCYDDVALSREVPVSGGNDHNVKVAPAGTIATVLFYSLGKRPVANLECYVSETGFAFGQEELAYLKLHMINEEKYPR